MPVIFALRCNGAIWVGIAADLVSAWVRHARDLADGTHPEVVLQTAWNAHGAASFTCEVLETINADDRECVAQVKELAARWRAALSAPALSDS